MAMYTTVKYVSSPLPQGNFQYGRKGADSKQLSNVQRYLFQNGVRAPLLSEKNSDVREILLQTSSSARKNVGIENGGGNIASGAVTSPSPSPPVPPPPTRSKSTRSEIRKPALAKSTLRVKRDTSKDSIDSIMIDNRHNGTSASKRTTSNEKEDKVQANDKRIGQNERHSRESARSRVNGANPRFIPAWKNDKLLPDVVLDRCYYNTYQAKSTFKFVAMPDIKQRGGAGADTERIKPKMSVNRTGGMSSGQLLLPVTSSNKSPMYIQPALSMSSSDADTDQREELAGEEGCLYSQIRQSVKYLRERPLKKERGRYRPVSNESTRQRHNSPVLGRAPKDIRSADAYIRYMASMTFSPPESPVFGRVLSGRKARANTAVSTVSTVGGRHVTGTSDRGLHSDSVHTMNGGLKTVSVAGNGKSGAPMSVCARGSGICLGASRIKDNASRNDTQMEHPEPYIAVAAWNQAPHFNHDHADDSDDPCVGSQRLRTTTPNIPTMSNQCPAVVRVDLPQSSCDL